MALPKRPPTACHGGSWPGGCPTDLFVFNTSNLQETHEPDNYHQSPRKLLKIEDSNAIKCLCHFVLDVTVRHLCLGKWRCAWFGKVTNGNCELLIRVSLVYFDVEVFHGHYFAFLHIFIHVLLYFTSAS